MRVGYVLRYFPARSETFVAREIRALTARGLQVEVASLGTRGDVEGAEAIDGPVWMAPRGLARWGHLAGLRRADLGQRHHQRLKDLARIPWLRALARRRRWDRVHVHFAGEALEVACAADLGLPLSVTVHASDLFRPRPSLTDLLHRVQVVTVCEHHRRWLARHHAVHAHVVRCGVELPPLVGQASAPQRPLSVVCVARPVPKKNLDALVRCLPPDATLRLVADVPHLAGPRVQVGALPSHQVLHAVRRADVFALPCRVAPDGDRDGVPVALMEAMAVGLPVISTDVSGIGELVDDSVGWLIPPQDDAALRLALEAARDPEVRRQRGEAAQERIRSGWTLDGQAAALHGLWGGVAS